MVEGEIHMKRISLLLLLVVLACGSVWAQNKVLSLDGSGDFVGVLDSESLNLKSTATVEAWVKAETPGGLIFDNMYNYNLGGYQLLWRGKTFDFTVSDGKTWRSLSNEFVIPKTQPQLGHWYYVTGIVT